jgi:hypothetical protein
MKPGKFPVLRKTHLVTIVLIALAFTILRFSGGKLSFSGNTETERSVEKSAPMSEDSSSEVQELADKAEAKQIKKQLREDVLGNIEEEKDDENKTKIGDGLEEIEKAIGLK